MTFADVMDKLNALPAEAQTTVMHEALNTLHMAASAWREVNAEEIVIYLDSALRQEDKRMNKAVT